MRIGLSQANLRVSQMTGQPVVPRKTYDAAISGRFPAEFTGGRWTVDEADIPKIAEALGMRIPGDASDATAKTGHKASVTASTSVAA